MSFNTKNNGLFKTSLGNLQFQENSSQFSTKGKEIKEIIIQDCIVVGVGGVKSFRKKDYCEEDSGTLVVDLLLPEGKKLNYYGTSVSGIKNVRCKQSTRLCEIDNGLLERDFIFDEYGRRRTGTLVLKSGLNYNKAVYEAYFEFNNPTKYFSTKSGRNEESSTLYGEKSSATLSVLFGSLPKSAFNNYKELFYFDLDKGDYYG